VSQVSAVTQHQSPKISSEGTVSGVDSSLMCSNLVDHGT